MARIISTFTTTETATQKEAARELISRYLTVMISAGFTLVYSNLTTVLQESDSNAGNFSNYKVYSTAGLSVEASHFCVTTPCGRFKIIFFIGTASYNVCSVVMVSGGIGDASSLYPNGGLFSMLSYIYVDMSSTIYNYEIVKLGDSCSIYCSKNGTSNKGFSVSYYKGIPLAAGTFPGVSFIGLSQNVTGFLEFLYSSGTSYVSMISSLFGLSDTLIGSSAGEIISSPIAMSTGAPLHQSIVNIETSLFPAIWANTAAYRLENLYFGRSTYPPNIISGVIVLNTKQYRVLKSDTSFFLCYAID